MFNQTSCSQVLDYTFGQQKIILINMKMEKSQMSSYSFTTVAYWFVTN